MNTNDESSKSKNPEILKIVKEGIQREIFDYQAIKVNLLTDSDSIEVTLDQKATCNCFNFQMVNELIDFFNWCENHLEVQTVLMNSTSAIFSQGLDLEEMSSWTNDQVNRLLDALRELSHRMLTLPQTIVCDLGDGVTGVAAELVLAADMRVGKKGCKIHFNHLRRGVSPALGGIGLLSKIIGFGNAKNLILGSRPMANEQLISSGLVLELYSEKKDTYLLCKELSALSPIARIQGKTAFLEAFHTELHFSQDYESRTSNATLSTNEWRRASTNDNFLKANHLKLV